MHLWTIHTYQQSAVMSSQTCMTFFILWSTFIFIWTKTDKTLCKISSITFCWNLTDLGCVNDDWNLYYGELSPYKYIIKSFHPTKTHTQAHLRQPVALRRTWDVCIWSLRSSWCGDTSQVEWGIITVLVKTARASWIIGIFRASQEDRFHNTPAQDKHTSTAFTIANRQSHLFYTICEPYLITFYRSNDSPQNESLKWKCTHPQAIQDVDEFVFVHQNTCSSEI